MKAKNSQFVIEKLMVDGSFFTYLEPESGSFNAPIKDNDLDIKYDILKSRSNSSLAFKIILDVNTVEKLESGYSFGCLCEGIFSFENSDLPGNEAYTFLTRSGLPAMYAHVRAYILNISSQSSGGPLLLPTIDLSDLINKKEAEGKKEKQELEKTQKSLPSSTEAKSQKTKGTTKKNARKE